jgi:hypothetical protein
MVAEEGGIRRWGGEQITKYVLAIPALSVLYSLFDAPPTLILDPVPHQRLQPPRMLEDPPEARPEAEADADAAWPPTRVLAMNALGSAISQEATFMSART